MRGGSRSCGFRFSRPISGVPTPPLILIIHSHSWIMEHSLNLSISSPSPRLHISFILSCTTHPRSPSRSPRRSHDAHLQPQARHISSSNILGLTLSASVLLSPGHLVYLPLPTRHSHLYLPAVSFTVLIAQFLSNISCDVVCCVPHPYPLCTSILFPVLVRLVDAPLSNLCGPSTYPFTES